MEDMSRPQTEEDTLRALFKGASQVIKDNKEHFVQYKALLGDKQFLSDRETVKSILDKYWKKNIHFQRLLGYEMIGEHWRLGGFIFEGTNYYLDEDMLASDDGINVIRKILDLIEIEYKCNSCVAKCVCKVTEHLEECDCALDLYHNHFYNCIIKDIIDRIRTWK
jgi:hypothetical protein